MKKILFFVALIFVATLCFPPVASAAVMQLTVTINNIQIPERSAMLLKDVNTEFQFSYARIAVVNNSNSVVGASTPTTIQKNYSTTVSFSYNNSTPFSVYLERRVQLVTAMYGSCKADCTFIANTSWYNFEGKYILYDVNGDVASINNASCPAPCLIGGGYNRYIAVDPAHVVTPSDTTSKYWRSPALFVINQ